MCQFKSGIILKTRCVVAQGSDDSHTALLEELNIDDTRENAMRKFVRVELVPPKGEWWTDPETWKINVDQDIVPDWFETDKEKYLDEFRKAVKEWWNTHVLVYQKIDELSSGYYRLKRCEVKKLLKDVQVLLDSSTVQKMLENSTVQEMWGSSTVQEMWGSSTVQKMRGNSTVQEMLENSTVQKMLENSTVQKMLENSTVQEMWGSSTVQEMRGNSTVQEMWDSSTVQKMCDSSIARDYKNGKRKVMVGPDLEVVKSSNKD